MKVSRILTAIIISWGSMAFAQVPVDFATTDAKCTHPSGLYFILRHDEAAKQPATLELFRADDSRLMSIDFVEQTSLPLEDQSTDPYTEYLFVTLLADGSRDWPYVKIYNGFYNQEKGYWANFLVVLDPGNTFWVPSHCSPLPANN